MAKIADDWMMPDLKQSVRVTNDRPPPKDGKYYLIERKKATPVSGEVAYITSWHEWFSSKDKGERDKELDRLRDTTAWTLRAREVVYHQGHIILDSDPYEHKDYNYG